VSPLRHAAIEGLQYAAYLISYLGWEPCGPDTHLHLWAHLKVAAQKTGPEHGEHPQDVHGLMSLLLEQHLEGMLLDWESEPGRTTSEVRSALLDAAGVSLAQPTAA
jgi:hypothetical protein